jgi:hypothetical protein
MLWQEVGVSLVGLHLFEPALHHCLLGGRVRVVRVVVLERLVLLLLEMVQVVGFALPVPAQRVLVVPQLACHSFGQIAIITFFVLHAQFVQSII